jgi:hypothetical protein
MNPPFLVLLAYLDLEFISVSTINPINSASLRIYYHAIKSGDNCKLRKAVSAKRLGKDFSYLIPHFEAGDYRY